MNNVLEGVDPGETEVNLTLFQVLVAKALKNPRVDTILCTQMDLGNVHLH